MKGGASTERNSSDLEEMLTLADTIVVMRQARAVGNLPRTGVAQEDVFGGGDRWCLAQPAASEANEERHMIALELTTHST